MLEYLLWQTFNNPLMLQTLQGCHSLNWVPRQTFTYKVNEITVFAIP